MNHVEVADWTCVRSEDISESFSDCAVTTLATALASPNSTTSPMISLPLMVRKDSTPAHRASRPGDRTVGAGMLGRRLQYVADTTDGVDERRTARVDLLAQVADVQLDDVRLAA